MIFKTHTRYMKQKSRFDLKPWRSPRYTAPIIFSDNCFLKICFMTIKAHAAQWRGYVRHNFMKSDTMRNSVYQLSREFGYEYIRVYLLYYSVHDSIQKLQLKNIHYAFIRRWYETQNTKYILQWNAYNSV